MARQLSSPEVHQEKRQVVQDVRAGDVVVELDTVEQRRAPLEENDVAQMKIAVTLPHEARLAASFEHLRPPIELAAGVVGHPGRYRRIQARSPELREPSGVPFDHPGHPCFAAMILALFGRQMKCGDCRRQWRHEREVEATSGRQTVEQRLLWEAVHLHEPVHRGAGPAQSIRTVVLASHGDDSAIEARCGPPVEPHFRLTQGPSPLAR